MDSIYVYGREDVSGLFNKRFIRTRVMRFDIGATIYNVADMMIDPEVEPSRSVRSIHHCTAAKIKGKIDDTARWPYLF